MAEVTTPLGHQSASGTIGHTITFRRNLRRIIAQAYTVQVDQHTEAQLECRNDFKLAVDLADYFLSFPDYKAALIAYCCEKRITRVMGAREWLISELLRNVTSQDEPPRPPPP